MGKRKKKEDFKTPTILVALYDYDPAVNESLDLDESPLLVPDVSNQLSFVRGATFTMQSSTLDWWILCQSTTTGNQGYIHTSYLAPLSTKNINERAKRSPNESSERESLVTTMTTIESKYFPHLPKSSFKPSCPAKTKNIFSHMTFSWLNSIMTTGYKRTLIDSDLWQLQHENTTQYLGKKFESHWNYELKKWKKSPLVEKTVKVKDKPSIDSSENKTKDPLINMGKIEESTERLHDHKYKPSISKAIFKTIWPTYLLGAFFKLCHDALLFVNPWLLGKMIEFIADDSQDTKWGYIYACSMFISTICGSVFLHQYFQRSFISAMRSRSALLTVIYAKMLRLSSTGRSDFTAGEMVNLMTVDAQKCHDFLVYLNLLWSGPLQIAVALIFLYRMMGWPIVAGFVVLLLLIPVNTYVSTKEKKYHTAQMVHKDARSKMMNEILLGINVLKLYAWENSFVSKIMGYRTEELKQLRHAMFLRANFSFTLSCTPFLVSLATFAVYVLDGNNLTAEKAFVAISLFNIISFPLFILQVLIPNAMQYVVSEKRLSNFLKGEELDHKYTCNASDKNNAVEIIDGTFAWNDKTMPILRDISVSIPRGSLIAVVGQVGTGKSSLLSAILGEIKCNTGDVHVEKSLAYVSQQAWIQNKSFRDNILFASKYEQDRYEKVIDGCALRTDIDILQVGDRTEIGEKGINLSGGQKQRVSLARAVYHDAELYLMDDPLSAVDAHVGKHIFDEVIGPNGLLKTKTRVLVTHTLTFLPYVDNILVLKNNQISESGSFEDLKEKDGPFAEFLRTYHNEANDDTAGASFQDHEFDVLSSKSNPDSIPDVMFRSANSTPSSNAITIFNGGVAYVPQFYGSTFSPPRHQPTNIFTQSDVDEFINKHKLEIKELLNRHDNEIITKEIQNAGTTLITDETSETGKVKRSVFVTYSKSIGYILTAFILLFGMASEALMVGTRIWLAKWSSDVNVTISQRDLYLGVYGALGAGQAFFVLLGAYFLAFGVIGASNLLHNNLIKTVMHCPMLFFETTPMGRIVNRFSKDINTIDEAIPKSVKSFISCFFTLFGTLFIISYTTPIFLAVFIPIAVGYIITQRFYVATSRQLKRLESVRNSPIYNHFFESINGASSIRAYHLSEEFIKDNQTKVDCYQEAHFPAVSCNRWLAIRLELCGHLITLSAALLSIANREKLSPGLAGLSISYALQVTQTLNWLVRMTSELETNIIAVERVKEYIDAPTEAASIVKHNRPKEGWPEKGGISFSNYSLRYREGLDLVLKTISFEIKPTEKIGIVGRTGAGKSTMALALFRVLEAASGKIMIDGLDISAIGLSDLRSKLTIIPQEPVLFSGTLRFNIDPFDQFSDEQLWQVLSIANLKEFVSQLHDGLFHEVLEGGENLSVGQRQLLCLTRALLRHSRILIMDEATSSVDLETDAFIQDVIHKEFADSTVLCIAHRLNSIMDYNRILVLDEGKIVEFDTPEKLLDSQGTFYSMAKDAGLV